MKRGAVDFLPKPFRDQDMLDAVMAAIERDRQRRAMDSDVSQLQQRFATLAGDLGISEITKIHRAAGMHKMGAKLG